MAVRPSASIKRHAGCMQPLTARRRFSFAAVLLAGVLLGASAFAADRDRHRSIPPTCPAGSILVEGGCVKPQTQPLCPPGTVGYPPTCRPAVRSLCPPGTVGVYPNCRPSLEKPPGTPKFERIPVEPRIYSR